LRFVSRSVGFVTLCIYVYILSHDRAFICPSCQTEIKLTESLAAPLIESTRREYEKRLVQKDTDVAKRDATLREREEALSKSQQALDDQVAEKLKLERGRIASEEGKKAKLALQTTSTKRLKKSPI